MKCKGCSKSTLCLLQLIWMISAFASRLLTTPQNPPRSLLAPSNNTFLSSVTGSPNADTSPSDPWTYKGPKGLYKCSNYHGPSVPLNRLATFLMTCMGDIFEATAKQGFKLDQPYPDGLFDCHLTYHFPSGRSTPFVLQIKKQEAPGWSMTFADIADDLEALWYAALWFEGRTTGFPEMDIEVYRYGQQGKPFLASRGNFAFPLLSAANVSDA